MERYCALGRLLPVEDDVDFIDDVSAIAEAKLVLREMSQTKSTMDALLERPGMSDHDKRSDFRSSG
jgi:hypothetical protein